MQITIITRKHIPVADALMRMIENINTTAEWGGKPQTAPQCQTCVQTNHVGNDSEYVELLQYELPLLATSASSYLQRQRYDNMEVPEQRKNACNMKQYTIKNTISKSDNVATFQIIMIHLYANTT